MTRRRLYTIAPHGKFLEVLADRILDGTLLGDWPRSGAFWLSDVTIFLPTKRARLKLAEIFADRQNGAALLPDIRALGAEPGETDAPFLPPTEAPPMPGAVGLLERRLALSHLVHSFAQRSDGFASPPNAAEIFWLANSLGTLIDDFTIEGVDPARLSDLVPEALAENWQRVLRFLGIALEAWPQMLAASGKIDAAAARNERLRRQAAALPLLHGARPVIAAGSTGSLPATADLLGAIADLPRGALVLPGLDTSFTPEQHKLLIEGAATQGHPQYGLMKLLRRLGAGVGEIEELAGDAARTHLVRAALAPADATAGWGAARPGVDVTAALVKMRIIAAPTVDIEARAIALAARAAIAERRSVGIVSRDQTLARRIAAELRRHDISVDDPAGTPLYQSGPGRLARQALAIAAEKFAPIGLIALLRNPMVTLGRDRADVQKLTTRLDLKLRRERTRPGLAGVLALAQDEDLRALLENLGEALAPVTEIVTAQQIDAGALAAALDRSVTMLSDGRDAPGLLEFHNWAQALGEGAKSGRRLCADEPRRRAQGAHGGHDGAARRAPAR